MGQDHLEERLSEQRRDITLHLLLNKHRPCETTSCSDFALSLIENVRDVGVFMLLNIIISLSLSHQMTKVSVLRGDECLKVGVFQHIRPLVFTGRYYGSEALFSELSEERL